MKQKVKMLKTLPGVDEGKIYPDTYQEGEEYEIGEELLRCFVELGAIELEDAEIRPRELAEGEMLEEGEVPEGAQVAPVEARETKVTGPEETKPADTKKKHKK